jgi:hypothetical protein
MRITLRYKRGDTIYNIRRVWREKEQRYVPTVRCTKFVCYLIYPEESARILYKCAATESWLDGGNLYPTRKSALKAIDKAGGGEK